MANENLLLAVSMQVSSDSNNLSAATDQFIFVHASDADKRVSQAYADDITIGVTQETAKKDEWINVAVAGITKLRFGSTITHGQMIKSNASGNAVRSLHDTWGGALALQTGATNDVIEALIMHSGAASA